MRKPVFKAFVNIFFILHFQLLLALCSPTHSLNSSNYLAFNENKSGVDIQSTTESNESLSFRLWGITTKPKEQEQVSTSTEKPAEIFESNERPTNISFYYKEDVANYPDLSKLEHLLKEFDHLFDKEKLDTKYLTDPDRDKYENLCDSVPFIITPKEIKNKNKREVLLVNNDKYKQVIEGEQCMSTKDDPTSSNCNNRLKNYLTGYEPQCKQNYITRKMVIVNDDPNKPIDTDEIPIPVCCVCVLRNLSL